MISYAISYKYLVPNYKSLKVVFSLFAVSKFYTKRTDRFYRL